MEKVTLENLVNRIETDTRLLKKHSDHKEMLERRITRTKEEMIKKLYEKDENDKYVHSFLERNAIYGIVSESYGLNERGGNFEQKS